MNKPDSVPSVETTSTTNSFLEMVQLVIVALLIVVPIRLFVAQPFIVTGASMNDTFAHGQYLIIDKVSYYFNEPERGDVVVFRYPRDPDKFFIKRIIGVPGDTVSIQDAVVTISNDTYPDGFVLEEPYIKHMTPAATQTETLGPREYFVMGDNRDKSSDSRAWGVLPRERIAGRAWLRLLPPSQADFLPGEAEINYPVIE